MQSNLRKLGETFDKCFDISIQQWSYGPDLRHAAVSVYCISVVQEREIHFMKNTLQNLVPHVLGAADTVTPEQVGRHFASSGVAAQPYRLISTLEDAESEVLAGSIVLFFDGWERAIGYKAGNFPKRQVTEPVNEPVVHGPREGTIEDLNTNLGMLRQRIKTPRLKTETFVAGTDVKTRIVFAYMANLVNQGTLSSFRRRIAGIEAHEVQGISFVEDWIEESTWSPFPQYRYTERTDTAAAALLDGKIAVLAENSPAILIAPAAFIDFFGTSEDYNVRTLFASAIRMLRILAYFIALSLPSVYIAVTTFHVELIPTVLLLAILDAREGIPLPAFFEALLMEIVFELLREAGIRLPRPVGSAVSIVGALVIGQAAIQAKIASPIMVIIVALTGIASFAIPNYDMAISLRLTKFPLMFMASVMGLFGMMISYLLLFLHLTCLHTLGEPYLSSLAPLKFKDLRDIPVRAPLKTMLKSPRIRARRPGGSSS